MATKLERFVRQGEASLSSRQANNFGPKRSDQPLSKALRGFPGFSNNLCKKLGVWPLKLKTDYFGNLSSSSYVKAKKIDQTFRLK